MIVYLEADCVIPRLIQLNFIAPKNWKKNVPSTTKYYAIFEHIPTKGKLCFEVEVFGDVHRVSAMYIHNLERIHDVDLSAIIDACVI
jgi:hypothetical protein